jgi:Mrp family chromosome partitioning ATPase
MRRRASNVYGRPVFLARACAIAFAITLLAFLSLARVATRGAGQAARSTERADTAALDSVERSAAERLRVAENTLAEARARRRAGAMQSDTITPAARARRDSLAAEAAELTRLLVRSDDAPLVASFRALGTSSPMSGAPHVAQLLDSLNALDKARSDFGASEGVDPVFVALTARVAAIGHAIEEVARRRRAELRSEIDSLTPPPTTVATIDTTSLVATKDSAERAHAAIALSLSRARNADSIARAHDEDSTRGMFSVGASTLVLAAAVVAIVTALALALAMEMRWPRIADAAEAELVSGARVLATVGERSEMPDRRRRSADREVPPSIEQISEAYRQLHGQLADATFDLRLIAIAGDHPFVTVSVAANLAAIAARSGRPTLLLDTDFRVQPVAKMMGVRATPGVADVLAQRLGWAGAITSVVVSRGRSIDVLPSGVLAGTLQAVADEFGSEVERLGKRYETVVLNASTSEQGTTAVAARAAGEVVVCLRRGRSTHASLRALLAELESSGATIRGLLMWDRDDPMPMATVPGAVKRLELMG